MTAEPSFTVKEIVIEIRDRLKDLADKVDRIDREGAIGTKDQLIEQARLLQEQDRRLAAIEARPPVTRADLHEVKGEIGALKLWQASLTAVAGLKRWQISVALGLLGVCSGAIGSIATVVWLHHS